MYNKKVVVAYVGDLDTSIVIRKLTDEGHNVIAVCLDVGNDIRSTEIKETALQMGAVSSYLIDVKEEFANEYALLALQAQAYYEDKYPVVSALARPLISKKLVEIAEQENATKIAHGSTGKGNDQVRFEVEISALNPSIEVIAPLRGWSESHAEKVKFAEENSDLFPSGVETLYSADQNLWGRANACEALENPWNTPPEDAYKLTRAIEQTPDIPDIIEIEFKKGVPVSIDGQDLNLSALISHLNTLAGKHGVGHIDHVENRIVGLKSREIYECPGAITLLKAHKEIEDLTLVKDIAHFKPIVSQKLTELVYEGLCFSPLRNALEAFIKDTQQYVNGTARVKLFKGNAIVEARKSPNALYDEKINSYTASEAYEPAATTGFIKLWGLPTEIHG